MVDSDARPQRQRNHPVGRRRVRGDFNRRPRPRTLPLAGDGVRCDPSPAPVDRGGPRAPPPASDNLRRVRTWLSRGRTARLPRRSGHDLGERPRSSGEAGGGRRVRPATARRACRPPGPGRPRRPRRPSAGRRPEPPDAVGLGAVSRSRLNRRRPSSRWLRRRGTAGPPWPTRHASTCGAVTSSMPADGE